MNLNDTIAAVCTPSGNGGISVIRISGANAVNIADSIFLSPAGKKLADVPSHTVHYGFIKDKYGNTADEVLVSVMLAPKTYTREDVVEISCHGGILSTKKTLLCVLDAGARMAQPGEFTKRAFLNGRIDLCEAESVIASYIRLLFRKGARLYSRFAPCPLWYSVSLNKSLPL